MTIISVISPFFNRKAVFFVLTVVFMKPVFLTEKSDVPEE